jgi:hypothetical protein
VAGKAVPVNAKETTIKGLSVTFAARANRGTASLLRSEGLQAGNGTHPGTCGRHRVGGRLERFGGGDDGQHQA